MTSVRPTAPRASLSWAHVLAVVALGAIVVAVFAAGVGDSFLAEERAALELERSWASRLALQVSWLVDRALYGELAIGFQLTNLWLQVAASLALLALLITARLPVGAAFAGALVFAVHPAQTEAVTYLAGRKETLSVLLALCALLAFAGAERRAGQGAQASPAGRWGLVGLGALCFWLALTAKESAVLALPLLWLLSAAGWDLRSLSAREASAAGRAGRGKLLAPTLARTAAPTVAMMLLALLQLVLRFGASPGAAAATVESSAGAGVVGWLQQLLVSFVHFAGALLWPAGGRLLTANAGAAGAGSAGATVLVGALVLVLLAVGSVVLLRRWPALAAGFAALGLGLLLHASVLPQSVMHPDRLLALPLVGLAIVVAGLVAVAMPANRPRGQAVVALVLSLGLLLVLAPASWSRVQNWSDGVTVWRAAVSRYPGSSLAHQQLALVLAQVGEPDEARREWVEAYRWAPHSRALFVEADRRCHKAQDQPLGLTLHRLRAEWRPDKAEHQYTLGVMHSRNGDLESAEAPLRKAVELRPDWVQPFLVLVPLLRELDRPRDAADVLLTATPPASEDPELQKLAKKKRWTRGRPKPGLHELPWPEAGIE